MRPFTLSTWTATDHVAPELRGHYIQLTQTLESELRPEGALEVCFAAEILSATWRLRRLSGVDDSQFADAAKADLKRARTQANSALRRDLAELRRLQAERSFRAQMNPDLVRDIPILVNAREILKFRAAATARPYTQAGSGLSSPEVKEPNRQPPPPHMDAMKAPPLDLNNINDMENFLHGQMSAEIESLLAAFTDSSPVEVSAQKHRGQHAATMAA